jgi:hypothetical protein
MTSALDKDEWQLRAPATLLQGIAPAYLLDRRLGGTQNQLGR